MGTDLPSPRNTTLPEVPPSITTVEDLADYVKKLKDAVSNDYTAQFDNADAVRSAVDGLIPNQTGNGGKFLGTDGSILSWLLTLPDQATHGGQYLTTDGSVSSWAVSGGGAKFKVKKYTRNLTSGGEDVGYTGAGFTPKAIVVVAGLAGASRMSVGVDDGTTPGSIGAAFGFGVDNFMTNDYCIYMESTTGVNEYAIVKSWDADGMTLTWAKNGAPSGTATFYVLYIG